MKAPAGVRQRTLIVVPDLGDAIGELPAAAGALGVVVVDGA